jgi:hypothetical protein
VKTGKLSEFNKGYYYRKYQHSHKDYETKKIRPQLFQFEDDEAGKYKEVIEVVGKGIKFCPDLCLHMEPTGDEAVYNIRDKA